MWFFPLKNHKFQYLFSFNFLNVIYPQDFKPLFSNTSPCNREEKFWTNRALNFKCLNLIPLFPSKQNVMLILPGKAFPLQGWPSTVLIKHKEFHEYCKSLVWNQPLQI